MSIDYNRAQVIRYGTVTAAISSGGVEQGTRQWCKTNPFLVLGLRVLIKTAATQASQTVKIQKSDTSGSFSSPTDLATVTIASTDAATTTFESRVDADACQIEPGEQVRVFHTVGSSEASLIYDYEVIGVESLN